MCVQGLFIDRLALCVVLGEGAWGRKTLRGQGPICKANLFTLEVPFVEHQRDQGNSDSGRKKLEQTTGGHCLDGRLFARCASSYTNTYPLASVPEVKSHLCTDRRLMCLVFCFHILRVAKEILLVPPLFSEEYFEPAPAF